MEERGTSGDIRDVFILCGCGAARLRGGRGRPRDGRPGLLPRRAAVARSVGPGRSAAGDEGQAQPNRLLLRNACDAYFSQVLRVISIPDVDANLQVAVDKVYDDFLQYVEPRSRTSATSGRRPKVAAALDGFDDRRDLRRGPAAAG